MFRTLRNSARVMPVLAALALLVGAFAVAGCGGSDTGGTSTTQKSSGKPSYETARKAQVRLDSALIANWNTANDVSSKPYACLRRSPRGGPALAACVKTCQACTISMGNIKRRVAKAYDRAPSYVQRAYHATYLAQMRNLDDHQDVLRALGEYARVHGASYYAGMSEFARAKDLIKIEDASAKVWQRRISKARERFGSYLQTLR